ncbi:MAG: hypothetical protein SV186_01890 [Candidatus Nanohaloarchaea archaeon]|nr:hypothetical protein [Candidatus Nanohaloarchaea archaeon]
MERFTTRRLAGTRMSLYLPAILFVVVAVYAGLTPVETGAGSFTAAEVRRWADRVAAGFALLAALNVAVAEYSYRVRYGIDDGVLVKRTLTGETEFPLRTAETVEVRQRGLDSLHGTGTVTVETVDDRKLDLVGVVDPEQVADRIRSHASSSAS